MKRVKTKRPPIGGVDYEYRIGDHIGIHSVIWNPDAWHLTCHILNVSRVELCDKRCSEAEIKARVKNILIERMGDLRELIKIVEDL